MQIATGTNLKKDANRVCRTQSHSDKNMSKPNRKNKTATAAETAPATAPAETPKTETPTPAPAPTPTPAPAKTKTPPMKKGDLVGRGAELKRLHAAGKTVEETRAALAARWPWGLLDGSPTGYGTRWVTNEFAKIAARTAKTTATPPATAPAPTAPATETTAPATK
jgi:hypothetical protein